MPDQPVVGHPAIEQAAAECVWPIRAELGEGPIWVAAESAIYFVDIKGPRIHRLDTATGEKTSWPAPARVGFIVPARGGGFVCGLQDGLHRFDPASGAFSRVSAIEADRPGNRINDGFVDPAGRLWFGTMDDQEREATGSLYRWTGQGEPEPYDGGYGVTNGPAISPDGRTFYHTDSRAKTIYAFDLDQDGAPSGKRVFARTGKGYPDGMAVDAEGALWVALFAGWRIDRYSPAGEVIGSVALPCANVTKLAFGGEDLRTAYATTAQANLSAEARAAQPLAGGLFRFRVDAPGLPQAVFDF
jgi:D-xylonolactonase